jgi:glutathione synthase/RimK-type ligase-like ATP-grasp enzyme
MEIVVIVAPPNDVHALSVAKCIAERTPIHPVILTGEDFPQRVNLSVTHDGWACETENVTILSSAVKSVWWRRPGKHEIASSVLDRNNRRFAEREATHAFDVIGLSRAYPVINRPEAEMRANRKVIQLSEAAAVGLTIPEYCITNDPERALQFVSAHRGDAVFKTLTAPTNTFGETRLVTQDHLDIIEQVKLAPVIFQRRIRRKHEFRVTIIGDVIFQHQVVINNDLVKELPDWRLDVSAEMQQCALPSQILNRLRGLMSRLDLDYGAVDLIEDNEGNIFFLEINPSGQFLFAEVDTEAPMSLAFCELLCSKTG